MKYCKLKNLQKIAGKIQNAYFGIPGGKGLFLTIHGAMKTIETYIKITLYLVAALKYWRTLVQNLSKNPTPVQILVRE